MTGHSVLSGSGGVKYGVNRSLTDLLDRPKHDRLFNDGLTTQVVHQAVGGEIEAFEDGWRGLVDTATLTFTYFPSGHIESSRVVGVPSRLLFVNLAFLQVFSQ